MSYQLSWYVEKRVISAHLSGEVTLEDVVVSTPLLGQYLPDSVAPVFLLIDSRAVTKFPTELSSLVQSIKNSGDYSNQFKYTVVVSDSRILSFLSTMVSVVVKTPIRAVKTIEEAEAYLIQLAPDLAPSIAARHSQ